MFIGKLLSDRKESIRLSVRSRKVLLTLFLWLFMNLIQT